MSDTKHDPFSGDSHSTPPEAFERPSQQPAPPQPDVYQPPAYQSPAEYQTPVFAQTEPSATEPLARPEPLAAGESVPALAVAGAPETRIAVEGSLWMDRLVEEVVAWLKTLASAAVYATLIVTFGFQVARVEGQSMAPTLADQDRLIVNKLAYRMGEPQVGDIVMLYYPNRPDKSFVKRVIAAEGMQVKIIGGKVYVNDVLMDDSFVPPEFRSHDDWGPQVIPEGYYFVMGDHRNNSSDSRHWGYVPKKYIIGRVQLRWWPLPEARLF